MTPRLTYANVASTLALICALGGTSYAAATLPRNSVSSASLQRRAVDGRALGLGVVRRAHLAPGLRASLRSTQVGPTGAQGPEGVAGDRGGTGPRGERGAAGTTGRAGAAGETGADGARGETGLTGADGARGEAGPTGARGEQGEPGTSDVDVPAAGTTATTAATFAFDGDQRASIGQQATDPPFACCPLPGSGFLQVDSGTGRTTQLTHYAYGSTIRSSGPWSNRLELFLGSPEVQDQPELSVRSNGNDTGAIIQARNARDTSGLMLDFGMKNRPRLHLPDGDADVPDAVLAIENSEPQGSIALATKTDGDLRDHIVLDSAGKLTTDGDADVGDEASDKVRFHGAQTSGDQGDDPGVLATVTAADTTTPQDIADLLNEQRTVINALRRALRQQGLIG